MALGDDLRDRLKGVMESWLGFWGAFIPQDELIEDDLFFATETLASLADELLRGGGA